MARQMIWGTTGIAVALFGPEHVFEHRRTLYSLIKHGKIPTFKMGRTPCAWSDQIEDFLESKACEAASNMAAKPPSHGKKLGKSTSLSTPDSGAFVTAAK